MDFKNSKTYKNLLAAFSGESEARNKYTYYASKAKKDGYVQISKIFEETADNEKEHEKIWFKLLHGGDISDTKTNLQDAIEKENYEATKMYKEFSKTAKEEGYEKISHLFAEVAEIEKTHRDRYQKLYDDLINNEIFKKTESTVWVCLNCGHIFIGKNAPEICEVCEHPQGYFTPREEK